MKNFKKVLSVFLAILCLFGMISTAAFALGGILGGEDDDPLEQIYGVYYTIDPISGISVMYKPNPTITFNTPKIVEVSGDLPLAVDYEFYAWKDENGKVYYPGDDIYVNSKLTLYAVHRPKTDNDSRVVRVIKTSFQTFIRSIQSFLGVFNVLKEDITTSPSEETTTETTTAAPAGPSTPPTTEGENTTAEVA